MGRQQRKVAIGAVAAALVVALVVEGFTLLHAHSLRAEAGRVDDDTVALRAETVATSSRVALAVVDLDAARLVLVDQLHTTLGARSANDAAIVDNAAAIARLVELRAQLASLETAIVDTRHWADVNLLAIAGMELCLDGVARFLNQVSVGDVNGAVRTAEATAGSCSSVGMPFSARGGG